MGVFKFFREIFVIRLELGNLADEKGLRPRSDYLLLK